MIQESSMEAHGFKPGFESIGLDAVQSHQVNFGRHTSDPLVRLGFLVVTSNTASNRASQRLDEAIMGPPQSKS